MSIHPEGKSCSDLGWSACSSGPWWAVLPDSVVLTIRVPETARAEPYAAFDGKKQRCLKRGESLVVRGWRYPVPAICQAGESVDWFRAVKDALLWNMRGSFQKPDPGRTPKAGETPKVVDLGLKP